MSAERLQNEFDAVTFPSMRGDVFTLYYRLAPPAKQSVFDGELRRHAAEYLACYLDLMRGHFPAACTMLEPRPDKDVGFIAELVFSRRGLGMYGFRQLENGDDAIHLIPVERMMNESNLARLQGAQHGMHFCESANEFRNGIDVPAEVIKNEVLPRIRKLVDDGRLNESDNPDLLTELVIEWVQGDRGVFGTLLDAHQRTIRYPLKLASVLECIQRAKLKRHFEDKIVRRRRRSGQIREHWSGSSVSFHYNRTAQDDAEIAARVDEAIASGEMPNFRARYTELEALERTLLPAIQALVEIAGPSFSSERISTRMNGFDIPRENLKRYLRDLSLACSANYRTLVERNFPTLLHDFVLYSSSPSSHFFVLGAPAVSLYEWNLTIYSMASRTGVTTAEFAEEVIRQDTERGTVYLIDGAEYDHVTTTYTSVGHYLTQDDRFGDMHLRAHVYTALRREWAAVERAFAHRAANLTSP